MKLLYLYAKDRANDEGSISANEKFHQWKKEIEDSVNLKENVDGFDEYNMSNEELYSPIIFHSYSCETS